MLVCFACFVDRIFTSFHLGVIVMDFQPVMCVAVIPSNRNAHVLRKLKYLWSQGVKGQSTLKGGNSDAHYTKELNKKRQHNLYPPQKIAFVSPLLQVPIQPPHCSRRPRCCPCSTACHTLRSQRKGSGRAACGGQGRVAQSLAQTEMKLKRKKRASRI